MYNNVINLEADIRKGNCITSENISGIILISYLFLMMMVTLKGTLIVMIFMVLTGFFLKTFFIKYKI